MIAFWRQGLIKAKKIPGIPACRSLPRETCGCISTKSTDSLSQPMTWTWNCEPREHPRREDSFHKNTSTSWLVAHQARSTPGVVRGPNFTFCRWSWWHDGYFLKNNFPALMKLVYKVIIMLKVIKNSSRQNNPVSVEVNSFGEFFDPKFWHVLVTIWPLVDP